MIVGWPATTRMDGDKDRYNNISIDRHATVASQQITETIRLDPHK